MSRVAVDRTEDVEYLTDRLLHRVSGVIPPGAIRAQVSRNFLTSRVWPSASSYPSSSSAVSALNSMTDRGTTRSGGRPTVVGAGPVGWTTASMLADAGQTFASSPATEPAPITGASSGSGARRRRIPRAAASCLRSRRAVNAASPPYRRWATDWPPLAAPVLSVAEARRPRCWSGQQSVRLRTREHRHDRIRSARRHDHKRSCPGTGLARRARSPRRGPRPRQRAAFIRLLRSPSPHESARRTDHPEDPRRQDGQRHRRSGHSPTAGPTSPTLPAPSSRSATTNAPGAGPGTRPRIHPSRNVKSSTS